MSGTVREDWRLIVAVVSGGHFFSHFYLLALPPLFPLLRAEIGLSNTQLGFIVSAAAIGGLLQMPVGTVVDRIGAKWVFVAGVGVTAAGVALVGLGRSFPTILALSAVAGLGQAAFHPADYATIDAVTHRDVQGRAFSVHTFSGYAGFAAAPVVVGTLALAAGWRVALFAVGTAGLLYAILAAVVLVPSYGGGGSDDASKVTDGEPGDGQAGSSLAALAGTGILAMVAFFLLNAFASKGVQTFTTVLAIDVFGFGDSVGNALLTAFFTVGAIGVLVGGVLADRFSPHRIIAGALAVGSTLLILTVASGASLGPLVTVGLFGLIGFFNTLVLPSRDRIVSALSARGTTGWSFGMVFTGGTVGALVGPVLLGAAGDATSLSLSYSLIGVVWLSAAAVAFSLGRGWLSRSAAPAAADGD